MVEAGFGGIGLVDATGDAVGGHGAEEGQSPFRRIEAHDVHAASFRDTYLDESSRELIDLLPRSLVRPLERASLPPIALVHLPLYLEEHSVRYLMRRFLDNLRDGLQRDVIVLFSDDDRQLHMLGVRPIKVLTVLEAEV